MEKITSFHLSVLQEIGNIGAGNAATSLSNLINQKIDMSVPRALISVFSEIYNLVGAEEDHVTCVNFVVDGPAPSRILFLLTEESAFSLIDMLFNNPLGTTTNLDEMGRSTVKEIGNILTGAFLTAFSDMTKMLFNPSVPAFAYDMLGAVLSGAFLEGGYFDDDVMIIETQFFQNDIKINGHFFLVPERGSLKTIFESLGLEY